MGTVSNYAKMQNYIKKNKRKKYYQNCLIGKKIVKISETLVDYYVKCDVTLDDGYIWEAHYRWADQEENALGKEKPENGITMRDFYSQYILNKRITKIEITYDRDDYIYCHAFVGRPKDNIYIQFPIIAVEEIKKDKNTA